MCTAVAPEFPLITTNLGPVLPEFSAVTSRIVFVVPGLTRLPTIGIRKAADGRNNHQRT
jgi:hypothetical protein